MIKDPVGRAQSPRVLTAGPRALTAPAALEFHSHRLPHNWGCQPGWLRVCPHFKKTRLLEMRIRQKH